MYDQINSVKELLLGTDVKYRKMKDKNNRISRLFEIKKLPAMLFFQRREIDGRIGGYFSEEKKRRTRKKCQRTPKITESQNINQENEL